MGSNAAQLAHFDPRVTMWVFEEDIGGKKLTEIINTQHENVKYLPGHKLPSNVVSPSPVRMGAGRAGACSSGTSAQQPSRCQLHWRERGVLWHDPHAWPPDG